MCTIRKFVDQSIVNENYDFAKVLREVAKSFKTSGFFLKPDWNHILCINFTDDVEIDHGEKQVVDEYAIEENEIAESAARLIPLNLLESNTSTPIFSMKIDKINIDCNISRPKVFQVQDYLKNLNSANWIRICLKENEKQSKIKFITVFSRSESHIETQVDPVVMVTKQVQRSSAHQYSSEISEIIGQQKANENFPALTGMKELADRHINRRQLMAPDGIRTRSKSSNVLTASINRNSLRVLFFAVNPEPYALMLKEINITIVTRNCDYDVLVTDRIRPSPIFMRALGSGKSIVSTKWLTEMQQRKSRLDACEYILHDESGEEKYAFSLAKTINAAAKEGIFRHCSILVTRNTSPAPDELKDVIVSSGGKYLKTTLVPRKGDRVLCVSDVKDRKTWPTLRKKYSNLSDIIHVDGFMRAIFQHTLDISEYRLEN